MLSYRDYRACTAFHVLVTWNLYISRMRLGAFGWCVSGAAALATTIQQPFISGIHACTARFDKCVAAFVPSASPRTDHAVPRTWPPSVAPLNSLISRMLNARRESSSSGARVVQPCLWKPSHIPSQNRPLTPPFVGIAQVKRTHAWTPAALNTSATLDPATPCKRRSMFEYCGGATGFLFISTLAFQTPCIVAERFVQLRLRFGWGAAHYEEYDSMHQQRNGPSPKQFKVRWPPSPPPIHIVRTLRGCRLIDDDLAGDFLACVTNVGAASITGLWVWLQSTGHGRCCAAGKTIEWTAWQLNRVVGSLFRKSIVVNVNQLTRHETIRGQFAWCHAGVVNAVHSRLCESPPRFSPTPFCFFRNDICQQQLTAVPARTSSLQCAFSATLYLNCYTVPPSHSGSGRFCSWELDFPVSLEL